MTKYKLLRETSSFSGAYGMHSDTSTNLIETFDNLEAAQAEKSRLIQLSETDYSRGGPDDKYIGGSSDTTYKIEVE